MTGIRSVSGKQQPLVLACVDAEGKLNLEERLGLLAVAKPLPICPKPAREGKAVKTDFRSVRVPPQAEKTNYYMIVYQITVSTRKSRLCGQLLWECLLCIHIPRRETFNVHNYLT